MSKWYANADFTLNCTVSPGWTLICVAYPWIAGSPTPVICQSEVGVPVLLFSQAMALTTGGPHGSAAAAEVAPTICSGARMVAAAATATARARRLRRPRPVEPPEGPGDADD